MAIAALGSGLEIRRSLLLDRLRKARPSIAAFVAPAGFGKSTLARQMLESAPRRAICDAAGIEDELDLARRIIPALAIERPDRTQDLTQRELMLADGGASVASRTNLAIEAWKVPADDTVFVFENAEAIASNPSARDFFARLLTARPAGRVVVICSRESLRLHLTRFASPHEISTLRSEDLAFDRAEMAQLFGEHADRPGFLPRIMQLSQGWPIAAFLLKRFANEGRIDVLLDRLGDVAFDELHDYLADQVLASLEPLLLDALFVCACIPHATPLDLQAALPDDGGVRALSDFAKESPFLTRSGGAYVVHPLLASLLVETRREKRDEVLRATAEAHARSKRFQRAAELHLARGDQNAAADALGHHEVIRDHAPSMEYARVLASLDHSLVQKYPRLWGVTALLRMFCVDTEELLDEAESLWRTLSPAVTPIERFYILVFRALFMSYVGLLDEAHEMLERFLAESGVGPSPKDFFEGYLFYLRGLMRARTGKLGDAERDLSMALPHVSGTDIMASSMLLTMGADIARVRGEAAVARQFVDRALENARRAGLSNYIAFDLAEAAFGAWFTGDDSAFLRYSVELDEVVHRNGIRGLLYFVGVTRARPEEPADADLLRYVACGRLIAASTAGDAQRSLRQARAAAADARQYGSPFVECLTLVALAVYDEQHFDETIDRAAAAAAACESPALVGAVRAVSERRAEYGMLNAFMGRLQHERFERVPAMQIALADGSVRSRGREVLLSEREHALLVALSLRRESVARSRLAGMLWPDLDEYSARNALSVCLHRLRRHLTNDDAIVRTKDGYALHDDVRVDLWEIDRVVSAMRSRPALGDSERATMAGVYDTLRKHRPERMLHWEWFEPAERHLCELRIEVAQRLAEDALSHGNTRRALELAEEMISSDPCDEAARQIAITAYLRRGDRAAAMRQYRQYRETLVAELQCEPSEEIKHLVGLAPA